MLVATVLTVVAMMLTTGQTEGTGAKQETVKKRKIVPRCLSVRTAIKFYRSVVWESQDTLHESRWKTRYPEKWKGRCAYKRYIVNVWRVEARRLTRLLHAFEMDARKAICYVFDSYCGQALAVAWCESRFSPNATNGQYRGLFQMGRNERLLFGHGSRAIEQSFAAHRYFVRSGRDWSPWSCKPW